MSRMKSQDADCYALERQFYDKFQKWTKVSVMEDSLCILKYPIEGRRNYYVMGVTYSEGKKYIENLRQIPQQVIAEQSPVNVKMVIQQFKIETERNATNEL